MLWDRGCDSFSKALCCRAKGVRSLEHLHGNWMGEVSPFGMEIQPHCPEGAQGALTGTLSFQHRGGGEMSFFSTESDIQDNIQSCQEKKFLTY